MSKRMKKSVTPKPRKNSSKKAVAMPELWIGDFEEVLVFDNNQLTPKVTRKICRYLEGRYKKKVSATIRPCGDMVRNCRTCTKYYKSLNLPIPTLLFRADCSECVKNCKLPVEERKKK